MTTVVFGFYLTSIPTLSKVSGYSHGQSLINLWRHCRTHLLRRSNILN